MNKFATALLATAVLTLSGCGQNEKPVPCTDQPQADSSGGKMGMMGMMSHDQMMKMHDHMARMRETMGNMMKETDPAKREQLMQQHMDEMGKSMEMMQGMMGKGMMDKGMMNNGDMNAPAEGTADSQN